MPHETPADIERKGEVIEILSDLVETLDVPPSKYEEAKNHYDAVGAWLDAEGSSLKRYHPEIYPQGSFALGTVVRPVGEDDYDVDTVCRLNAPPPGVTQQQLKAMVGDRLKQHGKYAQMIDPLDGGRRCWTLRYAEGSRFHLDILPAIPDDPTCFTYRHIPFEIARHAIQITDKTEWDYERDWPKSNPAGYAVWFRERMKTTLAQSKEAYARRIQASVSSIQDYQVRTPLQQAIQVLKRHRDVRYMGDEDKPISIIITTLAAQAYQNETTLLEALTVIIPRMRASLVEQKRGNVWWVANPVNPGENFADKWSDTKRKADLFLEWLTAVETDFKSLLTEEGFAQIGELLTQSFGPREASETMKRYADRKQRGSILRQAAHSYSPPMHLPVPAAIQELTTFHAPHRKPVPWQIMPRGSVTISAQWKKSGNWKPLFSGQSQVIVGSKLVFNARTDVMPPYEVFWQVVNTGKSARLAHGLRGEIFPAKDTANALRNDEETAYRGRHWIECFIVRNGTCLARSGEFIVNIV